VFDNEATHRAAIEKTRAIGTQPTVAKSELVPPLPLSNDELAAEAARVCPKDSTKFVPIQTEAVDARAPWQATNLKGSAGCIPGTGFVVIRGAGPPDKGWEVVLLVTHASGPVTRHSLAVSPSQERLHFITRPDAEASLLPTLSANGKLPPEWCWSPAPDLPG
jgi:hypothetical protein